MNLLATSTGFAVGMLVGMTGVGGGSLMTPLLIGAFRLSPVMAVGTDLWFAAATKAAGALSHHRGGHVRWRIAGLLLAGSLPASIASTATMHAVGFSAGWDQALRISLGVALLATAVTVVFRGAWKGLGVRLQTWLPERCKPVVTVVCGALLGVLVSLSSIGAGAIGAALIVLLHPRLDARDVVGTDIAHAVPLTFVAGIGYATLGQVNGSLLVALLVGSVPGIWVGSRLTRQLPERFVRRLLGASLVVAGLRVIH